MPTRATSILALLALAAGPAAAQEAPAAATREVVPGAHYAAGGLHRFFFGNHYRDLWTAPLTAEVLDLASFSGGLTPKRKSGGKQTLGLKLDGADGRDWKFRSLDKDPSAVLPPELRDTFADAIVQDQISAANPAAPLVVDALAARAGIPNVPHRLVILPDDALLGPFRAEFANQLGFLEEELKGRNPDTPGFESFTRVIDTLELWKRLDGHGEEKVDARAYLKARLFDLFLGDFDRHKDQWQWAQPEGSQLWLPVPEDRDQATAKYDGFLLWLIRPSQPRLVDFNGHYPKIVGLAWNSRYVDRRHLSELEWPQWEPVIKELQGELTDSVIDDAVRQLPPEHYRRGGALLASRLKDRRTGLPQFARKFYRLLADQVEINGSDGEERVNIAPATGGAVAVTVTGPGGEPRFERRFRPDETSEVRIFLKGGDDRVERAAGTGALNVHVVGGAGNDALDDTAEGHTRFYDTGGENGVQAGPGTDVDTRPYEQTFLKGTDDPTRDWGHLFISQLQVGGGGDQGLFIGDQVQYIGYGFRKFPFAYRHKVRAGYATGLSAVKVEYQGQFYRTASRTYTQLDARASEIDIVRFYGIGNDTPATQDADFFRVEQRHLELAPSLHFGMPQGDFEVGLLVSHSRTPTPPLSFIGLTRPYGVGDFGEVALRTRLVLGRRDVDQPVSARLSAGGAFFPKLWDVEHTFGNLEGDAALYLAPRAAFSPVLGLHVGAKKVFGTFPFFEAAFVGGPDQVRGLRPQRYAGDAAVFASAELHLQLFEARILLPTKVGVLGLADIGRVSADGRSSDTWHKGVGAGVWFAPLKRSAALTVAMARSEGATRIYIQAGFGF
jgi:hypothetical protein